MPPVTDAYLRNLAVDYVELTTGDDKVLSDPCVHAGRFARRLLELLPPADDGEPVSREWLLRCGWTDTGREYVTAGHASPWSDELVHASSDLYRRRLVRCAGFLRLEEQLVENGEPVTDQTTGLPQESCIVLPQANLRGQLRRLCAALGIALTEPKPAPPIQLAEIDGD